MTIPPRDAIENTGRAVLGTTGLTYPWWNQWLEGANSVIVAILGLLILALTLWNLILRNRIAARQLRELDGD